MLVNELMTKNVITVSPEASLKEVGTILKEKKISGIPVVNREGLIVGVVTISDLLRVLSHIYEWKELEKKTHEISLSEMYEKEKEESKVQHIMSKEVVTLKKDDTIDDIMQLMFEKKVHTIPITDEGRLVGIVGKRDLIHACF